MKRKTVRESYYEGQDNGKRLAVAELLEMLNEMIEMDLGREHNGFTAPQSEYMKGSIDSLCDLRAKLKNSQQPLIVQQSGMGIPSKTSIDEEIEEEENRYPYGD